MVADWVAFDGFFMGASSCWVVALAVAVELAAACTYMPNASWRRRGVATASRGVSSPLQWREAEWKRA